MTNPNVERVGDSLFNLLTIDDWFVGLFQTNNDILPFLYSLRAKIDDGEDVPEVIYVVTVSTVGDPPRRFTILDRAKIIKTTIRQLSADDPSGKNSPTKESLVYTAMYDGNPETDKLDGLILNLFPQIMEALYEDG